MSVKLRQRLNTDGTTTLYLDIYNPHTKTRHREFLSHLKLEALPKTKKEEEAAEGGKKRNNMAVMSARTEIMQRNKERLLQAKRIAAEREYKLEASEYDLVTDEGKYTEVVAWMRSYCAKYKKKDVRNMKAATERFKAFMEEEEKRPAVTFKQLTRENITDFRDWLNSKSVGEGGASYFTRFKKMLKAAYEAGLLQRNLGAEVRTDKQPARKKDTLTLDEIKAIAAVETESEGVKKAFLFSCLTGLRFCDVKALTWEKIDLKEKKLQIEQLKTRKDNTVPLNSTALSLLGEPGKPKDLVFTLPTANGANKTVKAMVKRAGIEKKITWHNARHSMGTLLILNGVDVVTASRLLGHTSLQHTQRYVNTADELKRKATDALDLGL